MQRYKLNTRFLLVLLILFAAVLGGGYGLWAFQVYRSAPGIKAEAEKAREAGRLIEANELWRRYLSFREDDVDAQIQYAQTQLTYADSGQANTDGILQALGVAEKVLRDNPIPRNESDWSDEMVQVAPQLDALREATIDSRIHFGLLKDALDHLDYLIDVRKSTDPRHEVLRLRCLVGRQLNAEAIKKGFELVGYDEVEDEFDAEEAVTPNEAEAYVLLAETLRRDRNQNMLADRVMNQLVSVNDDSYLAFLERSLYWRRHDRLDLASQDWDRAYALNQDDLDMRVLLSGAQLALQQEEYEQALQLSQQAVEKYPDNYQTYIEVARAQVMLNEREKALETIESGYKVVKTPLAVLQLLVFKCDLELKENRLTGARKTIEQLRALLPTDDIPLYFEGRALMAEYKWVDAVRAFEEAKIGLEKPEIASFYPTMLPDLDQFRGVAYQQLQEYDKALGAFEDSLRRNPDQPMLKDIASRIRSLTGRSSGSTQTVTLRERVLEMKKQPPAQQRWNEVEDFARQEIERLGLDEAAGNIVWAEYWYLRDQPDRAVQLIQQVLENDPPQNVYLAAVRLTAIIPSAGPPVAHELIDRGIERFGDNAVFRLERARVWMIEDPNQEGLVEKFWSLEQGSEQWDDHQRNSFLGTLADYFRQIRQPQEAVRVLDKLAELSPQDLSALMDKFGLAQQLRDNAAMESVRDRIEQIVGSKDDDRWQYVEAARLVTLYAAGAGDPQLLDRAVKLTDSIERKRPQWNELFRLRGDIYTLQGRVREAIAAYSRALELGQPNPAAVKQHAQLLMLQGEYLAARRVVENLPESSRLAVLGTLYPEILLQTTNRQNQAEIDRAMTLAAEVVDDAPTDPARHLWYADLSVRYGRLVQAEPSVRKAVELDPHNMQHWVSLVRYLAGSKRAEDAEQALREARLVLPEHELPLLMAQGYAMLGRWWQAEREYLIAHKSEPDNLKRVQLVADFYLGPFYPEERQDRYTKAVPFLNSLLRQEGNSGADAESVQWARRKAAEIFARSGDYQNMLKAEALLQANEVNGEMPIVDRTQLARILAVRPEPGSRRRAIQLLEGVRSVQPLDRDASLLLAQLYWKVDRQSDARNQIYDVVARYGDESTVWQTFVAMLLARGDYEEAARHFGEKLEPKLPTPLTLAHLHTDVAGTLELGVQVWNRQGRKDKALAKLYEMIPKNVRDLREEDVDQLLRVGGLLVLIGETDRAAPIYQLYASKRPRQALVYVQFVGAYKDVDEAFGMLEEIAKSTQPGDMFSIIQTGLSIINARRDEIGDQKDAIVDTWLARALRENPDSTSLLGLKADLFELQRKYSEAQDVYEQILAVPGFSGLLRARVLNNLAYLLALQNIDTDRALRLISEARAIRGPSSDILDTEAVVRMVTGNYNAAIENLELAVTDNPNAEKWFHLARAYWLAGRRDAAINAWDRATDFDLGVEKLNRMEHETFHEFAKQIEAEKRRAAQAL